MNFPLIIFAWLGVFAFRFLLLPFRAPNVEPLLATIMPLRSLGIFGSAVFAFSSIALYDAVTAGVGSYTWVAASSYALIAVGSSLYFSKFSPTRFHFVAYGVIATLLFDAITGPIAISFLDGFPFMAVLAAQIPITVLHLLGTVTFALTLSPVLAYLQVKSVKEIRSAHYVRSI